MAWEKSSDDLVTLFEQIVPSGPGIQHRKMFGYPCAFVNGNLFTGLFRQAMFFRVSETDYAALLRQPHIAPFEPMPGRPMRGYVMVHEPFSVGEAELASWMKRAQAFTSALAPKKTAVRNAPPKKRAVVKRK